MSDRPEMNDEQFFEELRKIFGDCLENPEDVYVLNLERNAQFNWCYNALSKYISKMGIRARLSKKEHKPFKSMGSISLEFKNMKYSNFADFMLLDRIASNTEIYPLTNGKVRLTFTFHELAVRCDG